ncbi:hypothetical protein QFC20_007537 [Naganishia adeliensis]|uniref:Uncharacterized protein n=1 Tax=Naganishia adeliensis TaxID=92952 RepID=A0ACC2UXW1_9TREE|nr:hypothetical protein QFC20_007537 [Naganishia adeliensis]
MSSSSLVWADETVAVNVALKKRARKVPGVSSASGTTTSPDDPPAPVAPLTGKKSARSPAPKKVRTVLSTVARRQHSRNVPARPSSPPLQMITLAEAAAAAAAQELVGTVRASSNHSLFASTPAELRDVKHARPDRTIVRRVRRSRPKDPHVDAPMRDILGLSAVGQDKVKDAALIKARGTRQAVKWVLRSLWDGHSTKKNKYRIKYGSSWSKIGSVKRDYLVRRSKAHTLCRTQSDFWDATLTPGPSAGISGNFIASSAGVNSSRQSEHSDNEEPASKDEAAVESSESESDVPEEDTDEEKDEPSSMRLLQHGFRPTRNTSHGTNNPDPRRVDIIVAGFLLGHDLFGSVASLNPTCKIIQEKTRSARAVTMVWNYQQLSQLSPKMEELVEGDVERASGWQLFKYVKLRLFGAMLKPA